MLISNTTILQLLIPEEKVYKLEYDHAELTVYRNRQFNQAYEIRLGYKCFNIEKYQHMAKTGNSYIILDIDNIDADKFDMLINSAQFEPNFYIHEFSKNKQCYTVQAFILLSKNYVTTETFIKKYKQLCYLFGADLNYQLKTGLHKIPFDDKTTYLHNRRIDFNANFEALEQLEFITDYEVIKEEVSANFKLKIEVAGVKEVSNDPIDENEIGKRNETLFEKVRNIAYRVSDKSYDNILHIAKGINAKFSTPLKQDEVERVAKSVSCWIAKQFSSLKVDPYSDIQRAKSAETRRATALNKVANAILELKKSNKQIGVNAVNAITKQNKGTISKLLDIAKIVAQELFNAEQMKKIGTAKTPKAPIAPIPYYDSDIPNSPSLVFGENVYSGRLCQYQLV